MAYTEINIPGDGVTTLITADFALGVINPAHVKIWVTGEVDGAGNPVYRSFTKPSATLYQVAGAPAAIGTNYVVTRTVPKDTLLVDYTDGDPITEETLNTSQKQAMMMAQEALDLAARGIKIEPGVDAFEFKGTFPVNSVPIRDADGNFVAGPLASDVANAQTNAEYVANVVETLPTLVSNIATPVATAAGTVAGNAAVASHAARTDNPHSTTKAQVGLGNVDNTSDASKPVSTAQATAIALKADKTVATTSVDGLMSSAMLTKLNTIATGATANSTDATLLNRANHTGTQSADTVVDSATKTMMLLTERAKLAGIATAATANSSDATLLARANHTGTQLANTISNFNAAVDSEIDAHITAGANITITYPSGKLNIAASGAFSAAATAITVTPAGNIASTNSQAALQELDTEKVAKAGDIMTGPLSATAYAVTRNGAETRASRILLDGSDNFVLQSSTDGFATVRNEMFAASATGVVTAVNGFINTKSVQIANGTDLNSLTNSGQFDGVTLVNAPLGMADWFHIQVQRSSQGTTYVVQRVHLLTGGIAPSVWWSRVCKNGTWSSWAPEGGYITPEHCSATGYDTADAASTGVDATPAITLALSSGYPVLFKKWYRVTSRIITSLIANRGLTIAASNNGGLALTGSGAITINNITTASPYSSAFSQVSIRDLTLVYYYDGGNDFLSIQAPDGNIGSATPTLFMENVHIVPSQQAYGPSAANAVCSLRNIRNAHIINCSATGSYFNFRGYGFFCTAGANTAPVEVQFTNCRVNHAQYGFWVQQAAGSTANDEAQGWHFYGCAVLAADFCFQLDGGPEYFGGWWVLEGCHGNFRERGFLSTNAQMLRISNCFFLAGVGNAPSGTAAGISINDAGSSVATNNSVTNTRVQFDGTTTANRFGIVMQGGNARGHCLGNTVSVATTPYTLAATITNANNISF